MDEAFIGIDLGTTNTLVCYEKKGKPVTIHFPGSGEMLPSVLYVKENGEYVIGKQAKELIIPDPENGIYSSKTFMGDFKKTWKCRNHDFTPTDVASEILKEVYKTVAKKLKLEPDKTINAVITVPAYFNSNQNDETRKAGEAAGFNVLRIITEPMAAAVAAIKELNLESDGKVFVVDLGGGTFDLSVLKPDHVNHTYTAIDIDGDRHLGGDDFDILLYQRFLHNIEEKIGIDLSSQKNSGLSYKSYYSMIGRLRRAAEQAKINLSTEDIWTIDEANLFTFNGKNFDFTQSITRREFDNICKPLYTKITDRIEKFISISKKFRLDEIDYIILAGGSCYIPKIQEEVERIFKKKVNTEIDRSKLVVIGACIVAKDGMAAININDIISHSLGVEVVNPSNNLPIFSKILQKGDIYPCEKTKEYTTTSDNQTSICVNIYEAGSDYEGELSIEKHDFYGSLMLEGIAEAPAGEAKIAITFSYDKSKVLTVTAKDTASGKSQSVKVQKGVRAKKNEHTKKAIDFMLLLDVSGSMAGNPLLQAKEACRALFTSIIDLSYHSIGLVTFDSSAVLRMRPSHNPEELWASVESVVAMGGTNLKDALQIAHDATLDSKNQKVFLVVTDGEPSDTRLVLYYADSLKNAGFRIVSIGAGSGVNKTFLKEFSSQNDFYGIDNMSQLKQTFKQVIDKIIEK